MLQKNSKRYMLVLLTVALLISSTIMIVYADSGTLTMNSAGLTASYSGDGTWSGGGNAASGTVNGTDKECVTDSDKARTTTLTFTNTNDSERRFSFDYTIGSNTGSIKIGGSTITSNGSHSATLAAGATFEIELTSGKGSGKITSLELTNISLIQEGQQTTITFLPGENGSYTVDGSAITAQTEISKESTVPFALSATPHSGYDFFGWQNVATGSYVSYKATDSITQGENITLKPVFISSSMPLFQVGAGQYFDLSDAATAANSDSTKRITLIRDGTLPAGNYTIPVGVTLLIPYNSNNTLCTNEPTLVALNGTPYINATLAESYITPTAYRTLTMASGASITVNGAISLSGKLYPARGDRPDWPCGVTGPTSFLKMESGSSITLNSGSKLYAYGYITGSGSVTAKSGSTVYEMFQFMGFRGGTQSSSGDMKDRRIFPISQYYVQNIEVPLTLESGATEYAYASIFMSKSLTNTAVKFISSSGAMFNTTSGSATKKYDGSKDRLILEMSGDATLSSVDISIVSSDGYDLPLNNNITVHIKSGNTTVSQDIAMLPGSELVIDQGATLTTDKQLYLYDSAHWGNYCKSTNNVPFIALKYVPGRSYNRTTADLKDALLKVNGNLVISPSGGLRTSSGVDGTPSDGGANITSDKGGTITMAKVDAKDGYQCIQGDTSTYPAINFTSAKLKNADGSYTLTENAGSDAVTYTYSEGKWHCAEGSHQFTEPSDQLVKAADCTNAAVYKAKCAVCGDMSETVTVSSGVSLGHDLETYAAEAPTCTETGLTAGEKCNRCDYELAQNVVPALGHTTVVDPAVAPSCTTTGLTEGSHCGRCDYVHVAQTVVDALGHTEEVISAVGATCTANGLTEGKKCSVCSEILVAQVETEKLAHTEEIIPAVDATCSKPGSTEGKKCAVCKETLVEPEELPITDHPGEIPIPGKDATCTEPGLTEGTKCSSCNQVIVEQTVVDALGHTEVADEAVAPTCTTTGLTAGSHCSVCNVPIVEQTVVDARGHDYASVVTPPTCTDAGYTTYTCGTCGDSYVDDEVNALGHAWHNEETGKYGVCTVCDEKCETHPDEDANGTCDICGCTHEYDRTDPKADCAEGAYSTLTCKHCDYSYQTQFTPTGDHDAVTDEAKAPTCTETGLTAGSHCSKCGKILTAQTVVDALGHNYVSVVTPPTCAADGYTTYTCSRCSYSYTEQGDPATGEHDLAEAVMENETGIPCEAEYSYDRVVYCKVCEEEQSRETIKGAASGHTYGAPVVTPPTCEDAGYTTQTCTVCSYVMTTDNKPATGHTQVKDEAKDATCNDTGLTEGSHCSVCGKVNVAQTVVPAKGHSVQYVQPNEAKCEISGNIAYFACENCEKIFSDKDGTQELEPEDVVIPALEHKNDITLEAQAATCTKTGLTEGKQCSVCETITVPQDVVDATGHSYSPAVTAPTCTAQGYTTHTCSACNDTYTDSYVGAIGHNYTSAVTAPTCTEKGFTTYTCASCGGHYTDNYVDALGHTEEAVAGKDATCTENGLTAGTKCSVCGETIKAQETIDALGHTVVVDEAVEPTFTSTGLTAGSHCSVCNEVLLKQEEIPAKVAVAQIGEESNVQQFATVEEAVTAATEGDVIVLLADVEETVTVSKSISIHLKGFSVNIVAGLDYTKMEDTTDPDNTIVTISRKALSSYAKTLMFKDNIKIKYIFAFNGDETYDADYLYAHGGIRIWGYGVDPQDSNSPYVDIPHLKKETSAPGKDNLYYAYSMGIPAKNMGETIHACAYLEVDGEMIFSDITPYSPLIYAENMYKKPNTRESQKDLLIALMDYGAAAQDYFVVKGDYDDPGTRMNGFLTDATRKWSWNADLIKPVMLVENLEASDGIMFAQDDRIQILGKNLAFKDQVGTIMLYQIEDDLLSTATDHGLIYWKEAVYNTEGKLTLDNASGTVSPLKKSENLPAAVNEELITGYSAYQETIFGTAAKNLGDTIFVTAYVTVGDQTYYGEVVSYSAHVYAQNMIEKGTTYLPELCQKMVIYSKAAEVHFGNNSTPAT